MYFSYCIKTKDENEVSRTWTTVELSDCGEFVVNAQGVKCKLGHNFLRYHHVFHEFPKTELELNRCLTNGVADGSSSQTSNQSHG